MVQMPQSSDSVSHHHHHVSWPGSRRKRFVFVAGAIAVVILNATGLVTNVFGVDTALIVALAGGYPLAARAVGAALAKQITYDITIAFAAALAIITGQFLAAAEVVLIILVGDALEHWAIHRADHAIAGLLAVQPERASVVRDGREEIVPAADVRLSDRVIVRSGERVPVDGVVIEGQAAVDQSLITGESLVASKGPGAQVFGGSIVEYGAIDVRPERVGEETTLARIGRLVADAKRRQAPIVRTADRLSRIFLPILLVCAAAVYLLTGETTRSIAVLLVACSCALVYAAPAAFAVALARLAREGVLVKGGDVLERLSRVAVVAFDKTGTLTIGRPSIGEVTAASGFTSDEVLRLAAAAERRSEHALGRAIVAEAERRQLVIPAADRFEARPGLGIVATVETREVRVGSLAFVRELPQSAIDEFQRLAALTGRSADTHVVVAIDNRPAGLLALHDAPRPGAAAAIDALRAVGVRKILLLTGDDRRTAMAIAEEVGIHADDVHAGLLPEDKLRHLREFGGTGEPGDKTLMVGDGVNDAPALAAADVGIAFGRGAADLSAEAAQVVLLEPRLAAIADLIAFARKTVTRVQFNILAFAVGVNILAIVAAGLGYLTPAASAILHQAVSLLVILASVSLLVEGRAIGVARSWLDSRATLMAALQTWAITWSAAGGNWAGRHRRELFRAGISVGLIGWVWSGVTVLQPGESGVVQRFGRLVNGDLRPGLHVRAPWPIETVTRLTPQRVRMLDIGFRAPAAAQSGPTDLEWNTFHGNGQVQQVPDENLVLTGDENLSELYAVVHYSISDPARYLFGVRDQDALVRMMAEGTLRGIVASYSLDTLLTTERQALEHRWAGAMRARLEAIGAGIDVIGIHLTDVHPPVEVVEAFRDVASAQEQQTMTVNEAEAYSKEQIPIARGNALAKLETAKGYRANRILHSEGDASRFLARASQLGTSPITTFRLQMETLESILPDKRIAITDDRRGARRTWTFIGGDTGSLLKVLAGGPGTASDDEESPPVPGTSK